MLDSARFISKLQDALEFAATQVRTIVERYPDFFPMYTQGGRWRHQGEAWTHWCDGFLPGLLWLIHIHTGELWFRQQAERYSRRLESRQHDRDVHDLGFIFMSTYHHWYRLSRDPALRDVLIQAGRTMGLRFKPTRSSSIS
jgi:unsaturated chondroitin disaccharide hydrolase